MLLRGFSGSETFSSSAPSMRVLPNYLHIRPRSQPRLSCLPLLPVVTCQGEKARNVQDTGMTFDMDLSFGSDSSVHSKNSLTLSPPLLVFDSRLCRTPIVLSRPLPGTLHFPVRPGETKQGSARDGRSAEGIAPRQLQDAEASEPSGLKSQSKRISSDSPAGLKAFGLVLGEGQALPRPPGPRAEALGSGRTPSTPRNETAVIPQREALTTGSKTARGRLQSQPYEEMVSR
eukprot:758599-Hanusia_phi.AAC.2